MGSSGDTINKGIDASVGGLVWVRRRNGSWWPGRIVGLNELSEGCLVSPRSGTPVKLLGREDASVDWYNLEKSKRVKAFRCGEYDECIEKAKASAANLNKKAVKYARRDDAILHALEIENARLGKGHLDLRTRIDSSVGDHDNTSRESPSVSLSCDKNDGTNDDVSDTEGNSDSAQELSRSGISFEEPNLINSSKVQSMQGRRRRTPNDSEDDGTGIKRMRGLEDLGVGVVSKKKLQSGVLLDLVQQNQVSLSDPKNVNSLSDGSAVNGIKGNSSLKRKRTQVAHVHEFLKRKNRRRPLTKVLESTAMLSVPVICDNLPSSRGSPLRGLSDCKAFELESIESKKTLSSVINNNSDCTGASCENGTSLTASGQICDASHNNHKEKENEHSSASADNVSSEKLFDVPFLGEEKHPVGLSPLYVPCSSGRPQISELRRQSSQNGQAEAASLRNDGTNELGSTSSVAVPVNVDQRIETGTSKWQLKGKRNSRQIIKDRKHESRKHLDIDDESNVYLSCIEQPDGSDQKTDCNVIGGPSNLYHCSLEAKSKPVADEQADGHQDWSRYLSQREPNIRGGPMTDVKLDDSLVPQRSLPHRQSRFTVPSRYQMPDFSIRKFCSDALLYDVKLEVKANYRPQHVPLVSLMSKLNGKAIVGHPLTVEVLDDGSCDINFSKMEYNLEDGEVGYTRPKSIGGRILTKHLYMQTRHSPSKSPKTKKSGFLQKKIRKLSSLTGQKQSEERKALAKKLKGPVIACVPLKLVFSRINEAVNGSARQTNRVLTPRHLK